MNAFSFCIYGQNPKYCQGLVENLRQIQQRFPEFKTFIYVGNDVPTQYVDAYRQFPFAVLVPVNGNTADLMAWRFFPIDRPDVQCMFPRDADSRMHDRDEWCVRQFLKAEDKTLHICRDHYWHKSKITGGIWGMKKNEFCANIGALWKKWRETHNKQVVVYDDDQKFLAEYVYPEFPPAAILIHSNLVGHHQETVTPIPTELFSEKYFMCNTWDYKDGVEYPVFSYSAYPLALHIYWLQERDQFRLIADITASLNIYTIRIEDRSKLLDAMFIASFYMLDYARCLQVLQMFESTHVDEHIVYNSNFLLFKLGKRIVGTTDAQREPGENEVVIVYGKYPLDARALPSSNKVYRNAIYFNSVKHDVFEYHPCWERVGVIYILNLVERRDRFTEIMAELCAVGAPLDRIHHYKAEKKSVTGTASLDAYLGATKNHFDVVDHFLKQTGPEHCLVLEDDFMFCSNVRGVQTALQTFFDRNYEYEVCLLATSKFGDVRPHDDLLNKSFQECTTTSGYLLHRATCAPVLECFREGYEKMKETRDTTTYVCDRYWARLQPRGRMFVFKSKLGYQRCCFSSILNTVSGFNFD